MNTLVVNLTRFGDLLQTQPVFTGLARRGDRVGLVCVGNFLPAAGLVRDVRAVFGVPGARLLADLDRGWPLALAGCLDFVSQARESFAPDRVINLTSSLPARLLAKALGQGEVLGFGLDDFGYGTYSTPWAAFLEATSSCRGSSPFNLADLFFKAAHLGDDERSFRLAEPSPEAAAKARELLAGQDGPGRAGLVGMQLGASAEARRWPAPSFARVGEHLWERHGLMPVLLGSGEESALAGEFARTCRAPFLNLTGRTGLPELAAVVASLRLLVSNDTGTMHLAAGLGVPVLAIFLATAQPWDTGPYLPGSRSLEPDMDCHPYPFGRPCPSGWSCRGGVPAQAAIAYLDAYLEGGAWPELAGLGVRAWESVAGADGFLGLRSLSGHGAGERAVWIEVQRRAWRRFLDGLPPVFAGNEADSLPESFRARLRGVLSQAGGLLELLFQQARVLQAQPRPALRAKSMATWQRLHALLASEPALGVLSHLWLHLSQDQSQDMSRFTSFAESVSVLVRSLDSLLAPRP